METNCLDFLRALSHSGFSDFESLATFTIAQLLQDFRLWRVLCGGIFVIGEAQTTFMWMLQGFVVSELLATKPTQSPMPVMCDMFSKDTKL